MRVSKRPKGWAPRVEVGGRSPGVEPDVARAEPEGFCEAEVCWSRCADFLILIRYAVLCADVRFF